MISDPALSAGCDLRFHPRSGGVLLLQIEAAARMPGQTIVRERLRVSAGNAGPEIAHDAWVTPDGKRLLRVTLNSAAPPPEVAVVYRAEIALTPVLHDPATVSEVGIAELPFAVLPYLRPSRYCQSDKLERLAMREFRDVPRGHDRVTAICNWIYDHVEYVRGVSDTHTSVHDTLVSRAGVCRDFAHLGISFCRALGIPARFVSCYAAGLQPPDFHAAFEAYLAGRWYLFDPTRQASLDRVARIAVGRDAADVSFSMVYGDIATTKPRVIADAADAGRTKVTQAVSLSEL